jgi:hypothetical protein
MGKYLANPVEDTTGRAGKKGRGCTFNFAPFSWLSRQAVQAVLVSGSLDICLPALSMALGAGTLGAGFGSLVSGQAESSIAAQTRGSTEKKRFMGFSRYRTSALVKS